MILSRFSVRDGAPPGGISLRYLRTYQPHGFVDGLAWSWVEAIGADYAALGHRVERGDDWLRVHGVSRHDLCCRINDPLGAPGKQDPRNPQATIKKYCPKVDAAPARGRKRYQVKGTRLRVQRLLGRPSVPLPGTPEARRRNWREQEQQDAETWFLIEEEARYLRPDGIEDKSEDG
jgi:hypothetical protein